ADDIPLEDLSVHLLEKSLLRLIDDQKRRKPRQVEPNPPSVLERMTEILTLLRDTWSMLFSTLAGGERRRTDVVTTLLAVLELVRQRRIRAQQTELFGEIVLERRQTEISFPLEDGWAEAAPPSPPTPRARNGSEPSATAEEV